MGTGRTSTADKGKEIWLPLRERAGGSGRTRDGEPPWLRTSSMLGSEGDFIAAPASRTSDPGCRITRKVSPAAAFHRQPATKRQRHLDFSS